MGKNWAYYFFDEIINKKDLDPNKTKIDERSYQDILICHIEYLTVKDVSQTIVNPLYLIIIETNGFFEKSK